MMFYMCLYHGFIKVLRVCKLKNLLNMARLVPFLKVSCTHFKRYLSAWVIF